MSREAVAPRVRTAGFSLPEVLAAATIAVILMTLAAPGFAYSLRQSRLNAQISELAQALAFARSEAIKRNARVAICRSADGVSCEPGNPRWEQGWIVFVDREGADPPAVADAADVLRVSPPLRPGHTLRSTARTIPGHIAFRPTGVASAAGRFVLCENGNPDHARSLIITMTGRFRVAGEAETASCSP